VIELKDDENNYLKISSCSDKDGYCTDQLDKCYSCPINFCIIPSVPGTCVTLDDPLTPRCKSYN
jgi:hypothetical protein